MVNKVLFEGLTFDDVLLIPQRSDFVPAEAELSASLSKRVNLNIPLMSAGMDTVTEWEMAAAIAREGGIGIIHKSMTPKEQAKQIEKAKTTDRKGFKDAALDKDKLLLVGAAIGANDEAIARVKELVAAGADAIVVDSAHGHSKNVIKTVEKVKDKYPDVTIIAGNVATAEGTAALIKAGADCIKVGMGPGAICTTRIVAGIGVPQLSAIMNCCEAAKEKNIPIIADGGIKFSGDIVKALGAGATAVMMGSLFAGVEESPGEVIMNRGARFKSYRGMGSTAAMERSGGDRYFQQGSVKFVPEGVEGLVAYKGPLHDVVYQMLGGLRSGMGYCGCKTLAELRENARFVKITGAGLTESHPHDLAAQNEEPNYHVSR